MFFLCSHGDRHCSQLTYFIYFRRTKQLPQGLMHHFLCNKGFLLGNQLFKRRNLFPLWAKTATVKAFMRGLNQYCATSFVNIANVAKPALIHKGTATGYCFEIYFPEPSHSWKNVPPCDLTVADQLTFETQNPASALTLCSKGQLHKCVSWWQFSKLFCTAKHKHRHNTHTHGGNVCN